MNKAKKKVEEKKGKAKKKVTKKCKAVALLACIGVLALGCQQTPSRSQTLTLRDCVVNIYGGGADTNGTPCVEIATQAMSIENSGTETFTPTQTTDTKPDIDVSVGAAKGGGILETAASKLLGSSGTTSAAASSAGSSCTDGSCTIGGSCTDGSCTDD